MLRSCGIGLERRCADVIMIDMERKLWSLGILGVSTPQSLLIFLQWMTSTLLIHLPRFESSIQSSCDFFQSSNDIFNHRVTYLPYHVMLYNVYAVHKKSIVYTTLS